MGKWHDIVKASPLEDYKVAVEFDNGECGVFDFSRYLNRILNSFFYPPPPQF